MKTLIIGRGEIGGALSEILSEFYPVEVLDLGERISGSFDIIHICFPYSKSFLDDVAAYKEKYKPKYIIIHSTVPVGTSRKCGAFHCPVVGMHPLLKKSILTFTKFLSGKGAYNIADYFRRAGIKIYLTDKQESTELMKILSTNFYGVCIEYVKEVKGLCDSFDVPFEMWTLWTENYNNGYISLGSPEFVRPNLIPIVNQIGGHCVSNNLNFLHSDFVQFLRKRGVA